MTHVARAPRTYGQFCPVAAGLDVVGDRWVLLILREMLLGRRRFSEIKRACPGIAPNLLSDRLRTLTERGLIEGGPKGYALTEDGLKVRPVLRALAIFGVDHISEQLPAAHEPTAVDALTTVRAFLAPYQRSALPPMRVRVVAPNGTTCDLVKDADATTTLMTQTSDDPDVTFEVAADALWRARRDGTPFDARLTGEKTKADAFVSGFTLDDLIQTASSPTTSTDDPFGGR